MSTEEKFPLDSPPSGAMTWEQARDEIVKLLEIEAWDDALNHEFPPYLPPSGDLSLDEALAEEEDHDVVCGGMVSSDGCCWKCGYDVGVY